MIRRIQPSFWVSLDFNHYAGGRTTIGGEVSADLQRNTRFGATVAYPFDRWNLLKAAYNTGIATAAGGDYDLFLLTYLRRF